MEQYISLLNEANRNLGLINEEITPETIGVIQSLTDEQQRALFNQMVLVAAQRGHENFFSAEKNDFRDFIIDVQNEYGWTIQDYMLEVLEGVTPQWVNGNYSDTEQAENLVKDYEQKVKETTHYKPFRKQFPTTVRDYEYRKSFYPSKLGAFIDRKIGMMTTSGEIWLKNSVIIDELKQMVTDEDIVVKGGYTVNNKNGILTLLEDIATDYEAFSQDNSSYNKDGVISITPYDDLKYIVTKASIYKRLAVREYASAFNLKEMDLKGRIIYVPEDYDLGQAENGEDILFFVVDRRAIVVAIKMWRSSSFYVANQYKTNHWLGIEGVRGHNRFINAVAYTGEPKGNFQ